MVYAAYDGPDELKMTWTYLPPGLDDFFAAIGRPRQSGEPLPTLPRLAVRELDGKIEIYAPVVGQSARPSA